MGARNGRLRARFEHMRLYDFRPGDSFRLEVSDLGPVYVHQEFIAGVNPTIRATTYNPRLKCTEQHTFHAHLLATPVELHNPTSVQPKTISP